MAALVVFILLFTLLLFTMGNALYTLVFPGTLPGWLSWADYCRAPVLLTTLLIILWLAVVGKMG